MIRPSTTIRLEPPPATRRWSYPTASPATAPPTSITFTGRLHGESAALAVAHAYQQATEFHLRRPPIAVS